MNNERYNQIIDEVWSNYRTAFVEGHVHQELDKCLPIEEFIEEIKSDNEFSQKWGLKIEERALTDKERLNTLIQNEQRLIYEKVQSFKNLKRKTIKDYLDEKNIPTRIITLTYKDNKIESYE